MTPKWDENGLAPCVVVDETSGAALMLAWMNREAWDQTLATREVHFYSRSRQTLWKKGETSGNTLSLVELRLDCDRDAIVAVARPAGPACHTGATSCFFSPVGSDEDDGPSGAPAAIVERICRVLESRRDDSSAETSYTRSLLDGGPARIAAKIDEEQAELRAELEGGEDEAVVHESADLLFHMLVALTGRRIPVRALFAELERRFGTSGHDEKASRKR